MDYYKQAVLVLLFLSCCWALAAREDKDCKKKHAKIIVLGAGVAGIKAAETFYANGIKNFLVLEGKDYIGGRINHVPFEGNLVPLGAGWIHHIGQDNPIWRQARKLQMQVHHDNYTDFVVRDGENGRILEDGHRVFSQLKNSLHEADKKIAQRNKLLKNDVPMRATLRMSGWQPNTCLKRTMEFYSFNFENGISPDLTSSAYYGVTGESSDVIVTDKRGYGHILESLAKPFMEKIILNTIVSEIKHSDSLVKVTTKSGAVYTADHVLVTVSSGVLNNNLIRFSPAMPAWKTDTVNLVSMCHYCKIFFKFPTRFWDDVNYILLAQKEQGAYVHWQNFDRPTLLSGEHVLLLTLTGEQCIRSEQQSDQQVTQEAMSALKKAYGNGIPLPTALIRNKWNMDPMTMGAYSNPVVGFQNGDYERLQAPVGKVWFAGEYSVKDFAFVHGAYQSGQDTARRMISCIRDGKCLKYVKKAAPKCSRQE